MAQEQPTKPTPDATPPPTEETPNLIASDELDDLEEGLDDESSEDGKGDAEEEGSQTEGGEGQQGEEAAEPQESDVAKRLRDLEMENAYLRGRATPPPTAAPPREDDSDEVDPESFDKELRADPARAILGREGKLLSRIEKLLDRKLAGTEARVEQSSIDDRMLNDRYPEYRTNSEFKTAVDSVVNGLVSSFGRHPGHKTAAAAIVYGEFVRMGKLAPRSQEPPRPKLAVRERARQAADALVTTSADARPSRNGKDMFDGMSAKDRASAQRVIKKLGLRPEEAKRMLERYRRPREEA